MKLSKEDIESTKRVNLMHLSSIVATFMVMGKKYKAEALKLQEILKRLESF